MRRHGLFLVALLAGVAIRVVVMLAFRQGFIASDAHTYLELADDLKPFSDRVVGYGAFLAVVMRFTDDVWVIAAVQHVLGLLTAVLGYALLRRRGVGGVVATLAMLPVLFDSMQLLMEHAMLSDVVFDLVLLAGVAMLAWRRVPTVPAAVLGGVLLGGSVLVRIGSQPAVLSGVVFCLLACATWRSRAVTSVAVVVGFVVPLFGYAAWTHADGGPFELTSSGGRALYMRTTGFVDCDRFTVPSYERVLCPKESIGHRREPTQYGWHNPDRTAGLHPPAGMTLDEVFSDFAWRAIKAQPGDYVSIVLRDAAIPLRSTREDLYEYDTAEKWQFATWRDYEPAKSSAARYEQYGGKYRIDRGLADWVTGYGERVYLWGPLVGALVVLALVGLVWRRRPNPDGSRAGIALTLTLGVGLPLVPVVTAEFVWRYVLPTVLLVPMAAALGWTRIRASPSSEDPPEPERPPGSTDRTEE